MYLKSSLPLVYVTLASLYESASAVSTTDVLDFTNLIIPLEASTLPLEDLGGTTFENFQLARLSNTVIGDSIVSSLSNVEFLGNPASQQSPTVAIIDPAHASDGGHITIPAGKRLESAEFFCCSTAPGESILEGEPCRQKPCRVTLNGQSHSGETIKDVEKTSSPLDNDAFGSTVGIAQPEMVIVSSVVDFVTITIGFTDFGDVKRRRRGYARRSVSSRAVGTDTLLIITQLVFSPLESAGN